MVWRGEGERPRNSLIFISQISSVQVQPEIFIFIFNFSLTQMKNIVSMPQNCENQKVELVLELVGTK